MSGIAKGVKKVFKAVGKFVKKIAKPVLIAAAVYFTGGLALSAFPATAGFAASMPGFGMAVGAGGSVTATGIFSKAASAIGLSGGLAAGATANAAAAVGTTVTAGSLAGSSAGLALPGGGAAGAGVMGPAAGAKTAAEAAAMLGTGAGGAAGGGAAAAAGMSLTDKLLLASLGTKAVGSFLAPSLGEQYEEAKRWRGAFYGTYRDGSTDPAPEQQPAATPNRPMQAPAAPVGQAPEAVAPQSRELMPSQPQQRQTAQQTPAVGAAPGVQAPVDNAPIQSRQLMAPGVRYV